LRAAAVAAPRMWAGFDRGRPPESASGFGWRALVRVGHQMWTPLARCEEYRPPEPKLLLVIPSKLEPVDYRILTWLFQGVKTARIASRLGRPLAEVARRIDRTPCPQPQPPVEPGGR